MHKIEKLAFFLLIFERPILVEDTLTDRPGYLAKFDETGLDIVEPFQYVSMKVIHY
jgi:hypothetical protein